MLKSEQPERGPQQPAGDLCGDIRSRRLLKALREQKSDLKFYSWDFKQNYTYITYLQNFRYIFNSHEERKRAKVFTHISKLLITRNPHQIKSHHQKMMMRHKSIEGIIDYLRLKIIKYLRSNPQYVRDIERINGYCEAFFLRESAGQNRRRVEGEGRGREEGGQEEELNGSEVKRVKLQEEMEGYGYEAIKNSQNLNDSPKTDEVKVEQGLEPQWQTTN